MLVITQRPKDDSNEGNNASNDAANKVDHMPSFKRPKSLLGRRAAVVRRDGLRAGGVVELHPPRDDGAECQKEAVVVDGPR